MSSSPPIGSIAFGRSGAGYPVIEVHADRIVLKKDDRPWAVNPVAIARWELPRPIQPGDRVRLKGTQAEYTVVEVYSVRCGRDENDEPFFEQWARLETSDGKPATWKIQQLEVFQ
jgi:hypothetical protein